MPEKNRAPKKAAKKPAPAKSAASRGKSKPSVVPSFYLEGSGLDVTISQEKPKGAKNANSFGSFEEAKSAAIDALVDAIEAAERRLTLLKRAADGEQLTAI